MLHPRSFHSLTRSLLSTLFTTSLLSFLVADRSATTLCQLHLSPRLLVPHEQSCSRHHRLQCRFVRPGLPRRLGPSQNKTMLFSCRLVNPTTVLRRSRRSRQSPPTCTITRKAGQSAALDGRSFSFLPFLSSSPSPPDIYHIPLYLTCCPWSTRA